MLRNTTSRARLLTAAEEVFYECGIATTSVDAVVLRAGVTKPTLYAHFPSKSALAAEALRSRHERRKAELGTWLSAYEPGEQRLLGVFAWLAAWYEQAGFRGCAFVNAAAETTPADALITRAVQEEKVWLAEVLREMCDQAGIVAAEQVASQLLLLIDGVAARVIVHGHQVASAAVADAARAAQTLVAAAANRHA
ncbi:TetR/AcrR family transcriptional regulator [Streptomyces sp. SLBN-31]|uniref:TetR/AcrR family transcriptional regulator n=1 Tax=Streptomyces sp. SLBN-31 TaxID=2768444 RepID=UPI001151419E|nr:TetR/AcrR family transcriptional regulator [Streptomyces sp. SLBN-31]TQJ92991.1 TetR family transcriptional regulator [Streptomyces sp. SLBN-31]